jgi:hypothetical protein
MRWKIGAALAAMTVMAGSGVDAPVRGQAAAVPVPAAFDLAAAKQATAALADQIERDFVFPETARAYAARLRAQLAAGAYDRATDARAFATMVTDDLQAVAPDGHLGMKPPGAGVPMRAGGAKVPEMERQGWIAPGIAFVRFNAFMGAPETLKGIDAFLDGHQDAKTLIVDLRAHRGGGPAEMDVIFPRLYAEPRTLMVMDTRASIAAPPPSPMMIRVAGPAEIVRDEHRVAPQSPRSPWATTPVILLTSGRTASAAEHFASALKESGRATLIGEVTAGAGNYGHIVELPGGYTAFIPFGHSYYPGTKGWEGTGVTPTVAVPAADALVTALTRLGLAPTEAARLSAEWSPPAEEMVRRRPRRA